MLSDDEELKECPFCGDDDQYEDKEYIMCKHCSARGPRDCSEYNWNNRSSSAITLVKQLRDALVTSKNSMDAAIGIKIHIVEDVINQANAWLESAGEK